MVVVAGGAQTKFKGARSGCKPVHGSFRDWALEAFNLAISRANLLRHDIDLLVVACESDFFSMQLNPASVICDDLGLTGVQAMRVEGGGASGQLAIHAGFNAIKSGTARHVAVVGVDPSATGLPAQVTKELYSYSFDAWSNGMSGIPATVLYALSIKAFMSRTGLNDNDLAAVSIQNRANAQNNPNAHLPRVHTLEEINTSPMLAAPYRRLHCSPLSDGAAAIILSHPASVPASRAKAPRITGIGAATDRVHLGARKDPGRFTAKTKAMAGACAMAAIKPHDIGITELYDAYAGAQFQAIEALGLSANAVADQRKGVFSKNGTRPVNLSGGLLGQGAPAGAIGVAQVATCAQVLEGTYHEGLQPANPGKYALADTHGGIASVCALTILERGDA